MAPAIRLKGLRRPFYVLMILWAITICGLMWWGISKIQDDILQHARYIARAHFDKDRAFRVWATSHGGVYVPVDDKTQPNPHLTEVGERDISTPSGVKLTLMNPAYIMRQFYEESGGYGTRGHITSLRPIRPENKPDEWEIKALKEFEAGTPEVTEITQIDQRNSLRFMRPMIAQKGCLKCHPDYKEGDVRGGVAISLDLAPLKDMARPEMKNVIISYGSIFLVGMIALGAGMKGLESRGRELQQAHEALAASEKKYRDLFDRSLDGVFITSRDGDVVDANQALLDIFGFTREDILGLNVLRVYRDETERAKFQEAVEQAGSIKNYPVRVYKKDGAPIDCTLAASVRLGDDGAVIGYQGMVRDITEQKKSREALENMAKELARSNSELKEFAYAASHDLQEPLRNIINCMALLENKCSGTLEPTALKFMNYAVESAGRMKTLIDDLLAYSRVGSQEERGGQSDCEEILGFTISDLGISISESGAIVTHDPLPTIMMDKRQLRQLFQNLLSNAIKFRRESAPQIHVSASRQKNEWLFSVRDNGIGIKEEHFEAIFAVFRRLHAENEYKGTGIGLALAKKVVERRGGRIWVESEPGKGSTFYFTVPDIA